MTEAEKVYRRMVDEIFNQKKCDQVSELLASNYSASDPSLSRDGGADRLAQIARALTSAMPDLRYVVDEVLTSGDRLAARWTITGTVTGKLFGIDGKGAGIRVTGSSFATVADGKLVSSTILWDAHGFLRQLNAAGVPELKLQ